MDAALFVSVFLLPFLIAAWLVWRFRRPRRDGLERLIEDWRSRR